MIASPYTIETPVRRLPRRQTNKVLRYPQAPTQSVEPTAAIVEFPQATRFPVWLRALFLMQQGSSLLTFCLATAVLIAYGSTVYVQQEWSTEYRKLEKLQREKRELTAANELVKNQLAQQANLPDAGLMVPSPANTIFLPKAHGRSFSKAPQMTTPLVEVAAKTPMGY